MWVDTEGEDNVLRDDDLALFLTINAPGDSGRCR